MLYSAIPIVGWLIDLIVKASLALPFWLIWTVFGLGEKYFYFLQPVYRAPSFLDCLGLFIAVPILYAIFIPKLASVHQINQTRREKQLKRKENERD